MKGHLLFILFTVDDCQKFKKKLKKKNHWHQSTPNFVTNYVLNQLKVSIIVAPSIILVNLAASYQFCNKKKIPHICNDCHTQLLLDKQTTTGIFK